MRSAAILLPLTVLAVAGCGSGSGTSTAAEPSTAGCSSAEVPAARKDGGAKSPSLRLGPERTYRLEFATNCGSFTVTLDQAQSPATSASLVSLARAGFFDNTVFHRIVPGYVIQGGDPTQSGTGGPGYKTVDTPPTGARYVKGVVAMAKTQVESPGTAGSQFFVVTGDDIGLPPDYAIVGKVTNGLAVVDRIGELGDPATEQPTQPVVVDKVSVGDQP